jgi:hypothetical protein
MSNVQVHCEHCNASLYRLGEHSLTQPPGVRLHTGIDMLGRDRAWDEDRHEFCTWACVALWALKRGRA